MNLITKTSLVVTIVCLSLATIADGQTATERLNALNAQLEKASDPSAPEWLVLNPPKDKANGKHVVLISGDDEYRSEQTMPMLGKILAKHHGFKCTVLFPINPKTKLIQPDYQNNIPGMEQIKNADLLILGLRFRNLPDEDMKYFVDYVDAGKPIIGTRTSTHAFNYPGNSESKYKHYGFNSKEWKGGFGQQVLGDTWISHHGGHKTQSCRGVIEEANAKHPVLKGVKDVWGPSDVYGIRNLPESATVLLRGAVLKGMSPEDKPIEGAKNNPMMPIAWVKEFESKSGARSKIFCTTMGASTDFQSEDLRRLIVNAAFWCLDCEDKIPARANVDYVGEYKPTQFGFNIYDKNLKVSDLVPQ